MKWRDEIKKDANDNGELIVNINQKPHEYVRDNQLWCGERHNPSYIKSINIINMIEVNTHFKEIIDLLRNEFKKDLFTTMNLIDALGLKYKTNGSMQRDILGAMVCLGWVKRMLVNYTDKQGNNKIKYKYQFTDNKNVCPYLVVDKEKGATGCKYDWTGQKIETEFDIR